MKRFLSFLMMLCLALGCVTVASAANPTITQQPVTQTVKAGGTATFSIKVTGAIDTLTWYFTNPATGETTTGKKLSDLVPGVSVSKPNSKTMTVKKVPESMHGWTVYCLLNKKVKSDTVQILISGLPEPEFAPVSVAETTAAGTQSSSSSTNGTAAADSSVAAIATVTPEPEPVVIKTSSAKLELYALDRKGQISGAAKSELTFNPGTTADFYVKLVDGTEGTIQYITIDSVRLTPEGEVTGMSVRGWGSSATVKVKINTGEEGGSDGDGPAPRPTATPDPTLDTSNLAKITCINCRFNGWHANGAESGEVPVGSTITVYAVGGLVNNGYSINGGKKGLLPAENVVGGSEKNLNTKGMASFQMVVTGDTTIEIDPQK